MSNNSAIEWTDASWVVTTGCTEASAGCANCYARGMSKRLGAMAAADKAQGRDPGLKAAYSLAVADDGRWTGVVTPVEAALTIPLHWKRGRRVFVNSMSDLFWGTERDLADARRRGVKDPKPVPYEFIDRVFAVMALCPRHTFQVLTKRPERMAEYLASIDRDRIWRRVGGLIGEEAFRKSDAVLPHGGAEESEWWDVGGPLPNVWIGTSVENQPAADERIPHLLKCPAAVRFLSCEPLLRAVDLRPFLVALPGVMMCSHCGYRTNRAETHCPNSEVDDVRLVPDVGIDWVIVGGESGGNARPFNVEWARSIVKQCKAAGVPVFVKQLGAHPVATVEGDTFPRKDLGLFIGDRKGGDMAEWPEDLRVREFPEPRP